MSVPSLLIVIPARYGSTRFPGKPLASIAGVSLIERVHRQCLKVGGHLRVVVATDDRRIAEHVEGFGGEVMMTRRDHPSGTDRVAEVSKKYPSQVVINVQGDEPLLDPKIIRRLGLMMLKNPKIVMGTLGHEIQSFQDRDDPNVVKVVTNQKGDALYFSRSVIPYPRDPSSQKQWKGKRHIGIYAFRRRFLLEYVGWPQSPLEKMEKLEQLRALERGIAIRVLQTDYKAVGVDVPGDVKKVESILKRQK